MSLPVSTSYTFTLSEILPGQNFKVKVTTARSKVRLRSHHDTHLQPLTNVHTKYQLPTPYCCQDIAQQEITRQDHYGKVKDQIKVTQ